jgi:NADH-quinone oxidoreductase subunit N
VLLAWRSRRRAKRRTASSTRCCSTSIAGMSLLASAQNTVTLFVGLELLSIPLYVLCATEMHRASPRSSRG